MSNLSENYLRIGMIVRPHGVKGALKLEPLTFDNSRFSVLSDAYLEINGTYKPVKVKSASFSENSVLITLDGVTSRDEAEMLRNKFLCVDRANAAKLPEGKYFITDMIGCSVYDTNNKALGKLSDVFTRPANDVYEIKGDGYTLLVPALKKLLVTIDVLNKHIVLDADTLGEVGLFEYDNKKDNN